VRAPGLQKNRRRAAPIRNHPGMISKFASSDIRDIPCGPYRIAYRIRHEPAHAPFVEIARIWHTARDDRQLSL